MELILEQINQSLINYSKCLESHNYKNWSESYKKMFLCESFEKHWREPLRTVYLFPNPDRYFLERLVTSNISKFSLIRERIRITLDIS